MLIDGPTYLRLACWYGDMDTALNRLLQPKIEALKVLVVDDDQYMRKVVRTMLAAIGVRNVFEASDGMSGLDALRQHSPDLVIVDWEMPMIDGAQFVRMVRSPQEFPMPDVPIIILSGHGDRWRVVEAARVGAHEYLLKPVSTKALQDRIVAILGKPRPTVQLDGYYGPAPRRLVVVDTDEPVQPGSPAAAAAARPAPPRPQPMTPPPPQPAPPRAAPPRAAMPPRPQAPPIPPQRPESLATSNLGPRNAGFLRWR